MTGTTSTARNRLDAEQSASALCRELMWGSGEAPEWIQLMPIGPAVDGRDGRAWNMSDPDAVVAASELPMVLDWEHATEIKAPQGEPAPAAGWIKELSVVREESAGRSPGIWGRVEWTPRGSNSVRDHEYRYVSPVFQFEKGTTEVLRLLNAALTNRPNLELTALNRRDERQETTTVMTPAQLAALCAVLGIAADSSVEVITETARNAQARLNTLTSENTALNARAATLVPVTDLETALNRAKAAEDKLATLAAEQHKANVSAALNAAQTAGKVSPASRTHYEAMCSDAAGLERFKALVETLPALGAEPVARKVDDGQPANAANTLSPEEKEAAKALNVSEAVYLAARNQENG